jgi:hypothetical protein
VACVLKINFIKGGNKKMLDAIRMGASILALLGSLAISLGLSVIFIVMLMDKLLAL